MIGFAQMGRGEQMDDLISRQAVIKTLCERRCGDKPKGCTAGFCTESLAVDCIPSVERKKGRWINQRNDNGHNIADCSECGNAIQWFDDDEKPKFCCMCGADMRERKEE